MGFFTSFFLLVGLILFRLFNAATTFTFAQPDEYWQSLEPAHVGVYGFGYLTWEWRVGLRSSAHSLLFSIFYRLLDGPYTPEFAKASPDTIVWVPGLVQAIIAALADFHFVKFAHTMFRNKYPKGTVSFYSVAVTIGSAYNWYMSTRTFSNSLEMALTTIALTYWPWRPHRISSFKYVLSLIVASASCAFRPTNALIWLFLGSILVLKTNRKSFVLSLAIIIVSTTFVLSAILDHWYYFTQDPGFNNLDTVTILDKTFVFPLWNFVKFNFFENVAPFYGTSPWHYYLVQGIPILLIAFLPFTLYDMSKSKSSHSTLVVLFVIAIFSLIKHKEVRFIYPILPILHLKTLNAFLRNHANKKLLIFIVLINLSVGVFFNTFHQRGVIDVMTYLRHNGYYSGSHFVTSEDTQRDPVTSVGFLMPCHSTPWQSHLHRKDLASWSDFWFLTCEPPIGLNEDKRKNYLDVADQFYANPEKFLKEKFPPLDTIKKTDGNRSQFSKRSEFFEEEPIILVEDVAQLRQQQLQKQGKPTAPVGVVEGFKKQAEQYAEQSKESLADTNENIQRNQPSAKKIDEFIQEKTEKSQTETEVIKEKATDEIQRSVEGENQKVEHQVDITQPIVQSAHSQTEQVKAGEQIETSVVENVQKTLQAETSHLAETKVSESIPTKTVEHTSEIVAGTAQESISENDIESSLQQTSEPSERKSLKETLETVVASVEETVEVIEKKTPENIASMVKDQIAGSVKEAIIDPIHSALDAVEEQFVEKVVEPVKEHVSSMISSPVRTEDLIKATFSQFEDDITKSTKIEETIDSTVATNIISKVQPTFESVLTTFETKNAVKQSASGEKSVYLTESIVTEIQMSLQEPEVSRSVESIKIEQVQSLTQISSTEPTPLPTQSEIQHSIAEQAISDTQKPTVQTLQISVAVPTVQESSTIIHDPVLEQSVAPKSVSEIPVQNTAAESSIAVIISSSVGSSSTRLPETSQAIVSTNVIDSSTTLSELYTQTAQPSIPVVEQQKPVKTDTPIEVAEQYQGEEISVEKPAQSSLASYEYMWPSHLVFFEALEETIAPILKDTPYRECKRFFNSYFHEDPRRRGDVIVYCR